MALFFFALLAALTVIGALGAILFKNLIHCALFLILFFIGIAGFYILLHAEFIAAVQILLYVGAVATLVLFAIMLTRNVIGETIFKGLGQNRWLALLAGIGIAAVLWNAIRHQKFAAATFAPRLSTEAIGRGLVTQYVLPFEVASLLLTAALIGAIVIAMEEKKK
jgi:NADH-quinone oxidoreductase subunit J